MSSKMLLCALASVAAVAVVAAPQDPSFEFPAIKHAGFDVPGQGQAAESQSSDKISVSFRNASVREVLDWLKDQGVNFVVGDDQLNKDAKINIHVMNESVNDFMDALAGAWSGRWEKRKDIWVFHKGRDFFGDPFGKPANVSSGVLSLPPAETTVTVNSDAPFGQLGGSALAKDLFREKAADEAWQKDLSQFDNKSWEEFARGWEKWARDYEKAFENFQRQQKGFDEKQAEQWRRLSQDLMKSAPKFHFQNGSPFDGKNFKPIDEKQMEEMRKTMQDAMKDQKGFKFFTSPDGKVRTFNWNGKDFKPIDEKQMEEMRKTMQDAMKDQKGFKFFASPDGKVRTFNWDGKDMKPIDEKQLEEMRKTMQDAVKDQKGFKFFASPDGKVRTFNWDGKDMKPIDEKQVKDMQKKAEEMAKKAKGFKMMSPDGQVRTFDFDGKDFKQLNEKQIKQLQKEAEEMAKQGNSFRYFTGPDGKSIRVLPNGKLEKGQVFRSKDGKIIYRAGEPDVHTGVTTHNLKGIYDSLTPAQQQKMQRLGYINYSDLNSRQRAMLGVITDDSWTISYKTDKINLTIKSDR